jgi:hypothetical protein
MAGFFLGLDGCRPSPATPEVPVSVWTAPIVTPNMAHATAEMTRELARLFDHTLAHPSQYYYLNSERAEELRRERDAAAPGAGSQLDFPLAVEHLYAGRTEEAIATFEALRAGLDDPRSAEWRRLTDFLAIAYLRLGEQQNCIGNHAAEACILPLQGGGIHERPDPARQAAAHYESLLATYANDYRSRWLLNVAYMTLGRYPAGVPPEALIPDLEPAPGSLPRFQNVAPALGFDDRRLAGSVAMEDFNNDGLLDLFLTAHRLGDSVRLYVSDGQGGYSDVTAAAGLEGLSGGLNTVHADYNNDGFADLLILRGAWLGVAGAHPNSLLKNNGDGMFEDVTVAAGLLSYRPTQAAAWGDFNNDGWLDLFIGNELSNRWLSVWQQTDTTPESMANPSELFLNNGDGTFTDVAPRLGLDVSLFVKGVSWGDVNNDGWLDLCVGNSDLRRVDFAGADLAREYLGLPIEAEMPRLYRNNRDETFTDVTVEANMNHVLYAMGANSVDLDNDGFEDAYFGTGAPDYRSLVPNRMFRNDGGRSFREVTLEGGFGHLQKGHGIAVGDLDRDGDQDIYAVMGGAYEGDFFQDALFENPGMPDAPAWIVLQLEGRSSNRAAIGARVRVDVTRANGEFRQIHRVVSTGGSFGSSSLQLEIGLGDAARIDRVTVIWPDAAQSHDAFEGITLNRYHRLVQGGAVEVLDRPHTPFHFGPVDPHLHGE